MFDLTYHKIRVWLKDSSKKESGVTAEIVRIGEKGAGVGVEGESKEESRRQNRKIQLWRKFQRRKFCVAGRIRTRDLFTESIVTPNA